MSHEIENLDTVILGSNLPAWHGLGRLFPGRLSPLRAYAEGVGARDIIEVSVFADGLLVPNTKGLIAITATGQRTPLSVVSDSYGVLKDAEFFRILEQVYESRAVVETAGTLRNGRRIWVLVKRDTWEVTSGDSVQSYDLWVNRHDGSGCFELHSTNVRVVCANTWRMAIGAGKNRVFGVRHTSSVVTSAQQAALAVRQARESELVKRAEVRSLTTKRVALDTAVELFSRLLDIDPDAAPSTRAQNNHDTLVDLFRRGTGTDGRTAWDAFNAVTEFVDHKRTVRLTDGRSRAEARFESAVLGNGDDMKAKAYDLLLTV